MTMHDGIGKFNRYPPCGQCALQLLRCGHGALPPLITAGAVLNTVSSSKEPQAGQGIRFSVFSVMLAWILCSLAHFSQRTS
jgi:hypothetical protein